MTKDIRSLFIRLATAKEIWDTVKETYSVNQLYSEVISTHQNGGSVITYFGKLQRLWQEYDAIADCTMECTKDVEKYQNMVNSQRVYVFLAGLDSYLDGVRGRILGPLLSQMFKQSMQLSVLRQIAKRLCLVVFLPRGLPLLSRSLPRKGVRKCTHCNGDNHVIEKCFKLHGYPDWHPKGKTTSNSSAENLKSHITTAAGFVTKSEHPYQGEDWQW